jgi:hypothetical protein
MAVELGMAAGYGQTRRNRTMKICKVYPICSVQTPIDTVKPQPVDESASISARRASGLLIGKPALVDSRLQRAQRPSIGLVR